MGGGGKRGAVAMGRTFKRVWWGGMVYGRRHMAVRSGEGRVVQYGGQAARCCRQRPDISAHGRRACGQHPTGTEIGEAGDC
jgi:hypothetical protein